MAYIKRMPDVGGEPRWRCYVHRNGKQISKRFRTEKDAKRWGREQDREIDTSGLPLTLEDLKKQTLGDIVRRYLKEKTPEKGCSGSETYVLENFLKRPICSLPLSHFRDKQEGYNYRTERLKETYRGKPITPPTVRREINSIQHVFEVAKEEWGLTNLVNPFRGLNIRGSNKRRKRRLKEGELRNIVTACGKCRGVNMFYVPLAAYLAIETGMRLQEIFNLTWDDIDVDKRRIEIRKSKTDHLSGYDGRTIVLTFLARSHLQMLDVQVDCSSFKGTDLVFPMTKEAFKQSWSDVLKRADIKDLTFHDLRREAGSRFDEAGLTKGEHDLMMGHANRDMTSLYIHADLKSIQDKLDRYVLGGHTYEAVQAEAKVALAENGIGVTIREAIKRLDAKLNMANAKAG